MPLTLFFLVPRISFPFLPSRQTQLKTHLFYFSLMLPSQSLLHMCLPYMSLELSTFITIIICFQACLPALQERCLRNHLSSSIKYTSDICILKCIDYKCVQRIPNLHLIQLQSD